MRIQEFDYSVDLLQTLLWQYNDAPNITGLLQRKQNWYNANQQQFWENWRRDVFDLTTANEFGLSVWAAILDLPLFGNAIASPDGFVGWGFGANRRNFNNGNFAVRQNTFVGLDNEQKRLLLRLRFFQITSNGTIPEINRFMNILFGRGMVYVLDGLDMTITYIFTTRLDSRLEYVLEAFDILPRPSGVAIERRTVAFRNWGFGAFRSNFNNGNFATE